jgi:multidrug resistance efflux pump
MDPNSKYFNVTRLFLVTEDYAMRPDLISFAVYGSVDYVDILLKANQISNPFSIDVGDILLVIDKNEAQQFYKKPKKAKKDIEDTKSLFINPDRASKKDKSRIEKLQKAADRRTNGASEVKPTNLKRAGEDTFTFSGGTIRISDYKSKKE